MAALIALGLGVWGASPGLAISPITVTAQSCNNGEICVTLTNSGSQSISALQFTLTKSGVTVTNVICPSSKCSGSADGGGMGEADFSPAMGDGKVTFAVSTSPSNYLSTFNATAFINGGGTSQFNNVQVEKSTATCPGHPQYPEPPGCADVAVHSTQPGMLFPHSFIDTQADFGSSTLALPFLVPGSNNDPAGFRLINYWTDGEFMMIQVLLVNHGPDPSSFKPSLASSNAADRIKYEGKEHQVGEDINLDTKLPIKVAANGTASVDFGIYLSGLGSHTFTAAVRGGIPDPAPGNNTAKITVNVHPPLKTKSVHWNSKTRELLGTEASGGAADMTSSLASGGTVASGLPVAVAVGQYRHHECSWVKSETAGFTPPSSSSCAHPVFLRAHGTSHWKVHLSTHVPNGSVAVFVRPASGPNGIEYGAALHNLFKLRIS